MDSKLSRGEIIGSFLLGIIFILILVVVSGYFSAWISVEWEEDTYVVSMDDTLYGIAGLYAPEGMDKRKYVHKIKELNNIGDSIIHYGDEIKILVPK